MPPLPPTSDGLTLSVSGLPADAVTLPPSGEQAVVTIGHVEVPGYEILGELGRGGMGVVYKARQTRLNRVVALKMILSGAHAGEAELARFRTEAESIARLQHPNIIQIHEIGEQDGRPFFSLEFCDGGSLDRKLDGTPLPPREAARLVETLAQAMHAAHERGVVHRDLKPANILLSVSRELEESAGSVLPPRSRLSNCVPKVTDFGLARKLDETGQTASGAVMGTPSYMAPEQAGGKSKEIGPPADVYALGAILYDCLTGRPPFRAASAVDTILQVLTDEPVPPARLSPKCPRDLETICLKCLQKDPRRRYASARALSSDLGRFLNDEPIQARPAGRMERTVKWARRRPALSALLAVSVLALGGLLTLGGLWYSARLTVAAGEARRERENAERERLRADEVGRLLAEVRTEKGRAERQTRLAEERLERARRNGQALQLRQVRDLAARAPAQGLRLLRDPALCPPDLRDFTWDHLVQRCRRKRRLFTGFVSDVAFAADGKTLAAVCWENQGNSPAGTATLWHVADGRRLHRLPLERANALRVAFSPDGKTLAVGDSAAGVTLWDVSSGKQRHRLAGHGAEVAWVAFSRDGKRLATAGGQDQTVRLWDPVAGKGLSCLEGHKQPVWTVAFSPDGSVLASGSARDAEGSVRLWNPTTGKQTARLEGVSALALAFSPDGRTLAVGTPRKRVQLWDVVTRRLRLRLGDQMQDTVDVSYRPDGRLLAVLSRPGGELRLWDPSTGKERLSLGGLLGQANRVAFSGDGKRLAVACSLEGPVAMIGELSVWEVDDTHGSLVLTSAGATSDNVAVNPTGNLLALPGKKGTVRLVRLPSGAERQVLPGPGGAVRLVTFSGDGTRLAAADEGGAIKVWQAADGKEVRALPAAPGRVHALALTGQRLLILRDVQGKAVFTLWNLAVGHKMADLPGHGSMPAWVAFSPDGRSVTTLSVEERNNPPRTPRPSVLVIHRWESATGKALGRHELFSPTADSWYSNLSAQLTPDGRALLAVGKNKAGARVVRWDLAVGRGQDLLSAGGDLDSTGLALSPDGRTLALAAAVEGGGLESKPIIQLWDVASGKPGVTLAGHSAFVTALAFSPDGQTLASGDLTGGVKLWDPVVGQERLTLDGPDGVLGLRFTRNGQTLLALPVGDENGDSGASVYAWTAAPPPRQSVLTVEDLVVPLGFRPDGRSLVLTAPAPEVVAVVDVLTGQLASLDPAKEDAEARKVPAVRNRDVGLTPALSPDGGWVVAAGEDPAALTVVVRDVLGKEAAVVLRGHTAAVTVAAFGPDAAVLATTAKDGTVRLWDRTRGKERLRFTVPAAGVQELRFTADGRTLAGLCGGTLRLWRVATGQEVARHPLPEAACFAVATDGRFAAWSDVGRLVVWDVATGRTRASAKRHDASIRRIVFAPDGRTLASGGDDRTVRIWDVSTGRQRHRLEVAGLVGGILFAPDGRRLVAGGSIGSGLGELCVWDLSRTTP